MQRFQATTTTCVALGLVVAVKGRVGFMRLSAQRWSAYLPPILVLDRGDVTICGWNTFSFLFFSFLFFFSRLNPKPKRGRHARVMMPAMLKV